MRTTSVQTSAAEPMRPRTWAPRTARWFDGLLVVALLLLHGFIVLGGGIGATAVAVGAAQVVPLWWRRSHPGWVMAAVAVASAAQVPVVDFPMVTQLAFPVAVYSAARLGPTWVKFTTLAVTVCAALVGSWSWTRTWWTGPEDLLAPFLSAAGIACTAWALGLAGSQRDGLLRSLWDRAEQAERMAERDVALAAQDERARIAREMHDVVAHGLSVIVVQADGARYAAAKDPDVAVSTLGTIAETGRDSLQEMRRLLGLLRTGDSGLRPQPRLVDVAHLVEEARAGGMVVDAELPEEWPVVPDGVGLAVYRLVQEALTNVRKHAGPQARVWVRVRVTDALEAVVVDDGRGAAADGPQLGQWDRLGDGLGDGSGDGLGDGLGLVGMRERVTVHGGVLDTGPAPGGGWRVDARIPL